MSMLLMGVGSSRAAGGGAPAGHRYWRISVTTLAPNSNSTNIAEMQWRVTPGGADQTSPGGGSITVSGTLAGAAGNVVDNDAGTTWHSAIGGNPALWRYDFGSNKDITEVTITAHPSNPAYSPTDFDIQYSDDDSAWTTSWSVAGSTGWSAGETRTFTKP